MTEWRVRLDKLQRSATVIDVFPDVDRMPVTNRLKEWGVDVSSLELSRGRGGLAGYIMASSPGGYGDDDRPTLYMNPLTLKRLDVVGEGVYLVLSHELAHFLQFVENRIDEKMYERRWTTLHEWIGFEHERDSIRWEARQARAMGWTRERYRNYAAGRIYRDGWPSAVKKKVLEIGTEVYSGKRPEERGVRPMFRRPVYVRHHLRRKL